ncbi:DUF5319 family protein [Mycobacterium kansasii]|uniref:DUF5319 family protein n=1 Tax=Mycobacterium kansasii TaxID=1768 RepID=UPI003F5E02F1
MTWPNLAVYEALLAHKGDSRPGGLLRDESSRTTTTTGTCCGPTCCSCLIDGTVRPHEPAYDPEPDAYVTWDYCPADTPMPRSTKRRQTRTGFHRRH